MKGIILAGGSGSRLYPLTQVVSKQLMPVYDKPMIYYPLSVLMLAGIRNILIISSPQQLPLFEQLLGDGSQWGIEFSYLVQPHPEGLAQAFVLAKDFIDHQPVCLILGDNLFYGNGLVSILQEASQLEDGALIFAHRVINPKAYGVVEFDENGKVINLEEKPEYPRSSYAVPGIYFYDSQVAHLSATLQPSLRGEFEITDLNRLYLAQEKLRIRVLWRGYTWLDMGTHESLLQAAMFIQTLEQRQGFKVACVEEIAYRMRFIDEEQLKQLAQPLLKSGYGEYLLSILENSYTFL
ncbi:glucose-1-phosphate thymidylyltransferase RfbA [Candidatus Synechococcus calcipolaris G9]|uniref:Glucose-1-phosphate thymidylyltransferase n=1 Tax=Candidatus Synechococcus calcipolaris G9 TaxID=1497997 RepID=A0ABT6F3R8_9SYNE|nr:glucose-1-phosphate thymidylyltransferase RfbA [Candidatus Synechococcus calcipolaris]MDG2992416.1 glucose-1-phosphate thymidylyltransferase RfbA [Candidatus Synechococcus calcipolaris G9]